MKKSIALFAIVLLFNFFVPSPTNAAGTIAYDNAAVALGVTVTTNNVTFTVGSGANRILFAGVFCTLGDDLTAITATKGGVDTAMTLVDKTTNGTEEVYLYYIVNPDSGSNTVKTTFNTALITRLHVASYSGASQTGVPDAHNKGSYVATSFTATVTSVADNSWGFLFDRGGTLTAGSGSTERPSAAGSSSAVFDSNGGLTPPGTLSMAVNDSGGAGAWIMASFAPIPAASATSIMGLIKSFWIQ